MASLLQQDIEQNDTPVMDCQALTLAPVEHVWDMLKQRICWRENTANTLIELHEALLEEWDNVPQRCNVSNVKSMGRE